MLLAGAYSYNDRTARLDGQRGALMPDGALRSMGAYFVDFILEYGGWAFYTDFMGVRATVRSSTRIPRHMSTPGRV